MINSEIFLNECRKNGYNLFTGTPCSYLKPFINYVIDAEDLEFVETTNEGDAVALAVGAWLGSRKTVIMFQNSGLGNAVNPLTSLSHIMKIPFLGIVTLRGEPGGAEDEPQHELMGRITISLLETMEIPWAYFPTDEAEVESSFRLAQEMMNAKEKPFFFVMKKDSVSSYELKANAQAFSRKIYQSPVVRTSEEMFSMTRTDALKVINEMMKENGLIIGSTGKIGRELFEVEDSENKFYMVGSMGCALPIGLGLGLGYSRFAGYIAVVEGDGSVLMRLGNMALAGQLNTKKLVHIVLDNGTHDSTGGQRSFSELTDFCQIAASCGYKNSHEAGNEKELLSSLKSCLDSGKLSFIRCFIKSGSPKNLGRPTITPYEVSRRLQTSIRAKL